MRTSFAKVRAKRGRAKYNRGLYKAHKLDAFPKTTRNVNLAVGGLGAYAALRGRSRVTKGVGAVIAIGTASKMYQAKKHGSYARAYQHRAAGTRRGQYAPASRSRRTRRNYRGQFAGSY